MGLPMGTPGLEVSCVVSATHAESWIEAPPECDFNLFNDRVGRTGRIVSLHDRAADHNEVRACFDGFPRLSRS